MSRTSITVLALALAAAACSSSTTLPTQDSTAGTTSGPAATEGTTTTATGATGTGTTEAPAVDPEIAESLRRQVAELTDITEEIRGLTFFDEPTVVFLSEEELAARVVADFEAELKPGEIEWTEAWLDLLGLLDSSEQPLLELYQALLGEQVVGVYEPETKELLVRADAADLSVSSRTTVVHELLHALTDQHFEIGERLDALVEAQRFDEASAYISFLEGEATFFQFAYIADFLSSAEAVELAREALATDFGALDDTPYAIAESLFFRYEDGLDFAVALSDGGIEAFNDAHRDPPLSTEQVAHPARFEQGEVPLQISLPEIEIPGYTVVESSTWGELGLLTTFGQAIGEGAAAQIGDGWGGDAYQLATSGDEIIFVLSYRGDSAADAREVAEAFQRLALESMDTAEGVVAEDGSITFEGEDFAYVALAGSTVVFVASSDPSVGSTVVGAVGRP